MQEMDEGARRWLHKTARQNYWRVAQYIDLDDLIQDGYLHYHRIVTRYAHVKSPANMMALFKRGYHNHLNDLSNRRTRAVTEVLYSDLAPEGANEIATWERLLAVFDTEFLFYVESPEPIRELLRALATDRAPRKLREIPRTRIDDRPGPYVGTRQNLNERFCALVDRDPRSIDLAGMLKRTLHGLTADMCLTMGGERKTISEWACDYGILPSVIMARLERGASVRRAITEPMPAGPGGQLPAWFAGSSM